MVDTPVAAAMLVLVLLAIAIPVFLAKRPYSSKDRRPAFLVPTTLPVAPPLLAGRMKELDELSRKIDVGARAILIKGQPGIGKTALALTIAHTVAPRFSDGQLFAVLNPLHPEGTAIAEALGQFVGALQRGNESVPDDASARLATYVKLTQRRRVLVVIDDVPEGMDIRDLVPSGPGCALIVTSRGGVRGVRLSAEVDLDPLSERDALELLEDVLGRDRVSGQDWSFLIRECHSVPLALSLAGSALATRTNWRIDEARRRLAEFAKERAQQQATSSPYDAAYVFLTEEEKNALRSLAAIGSVEFEPWKLAAAAGTEPGEGIRLAARLAGARLLERRSSDFSGLPYCRVPEPVLEYARRLAPLDDPRVRDRRSSLLDSASQERSERDVGQQVRVDVYTQLQAGELTAALNTAWDAVQIASDRGEEEMAATAYAALSEIYTELGDLAEAEEMAARAIERGNLRSTARALRCRGRNARRLRQFTEAAHHFDAALRRATEVGEGYESVRIHTEYAAMEALRGHLDAARRHVAAAAEQVGRGATDELRTRLAWAGAAVLTAAGDFDEAARTLLAARETEDVQLLQQAWIDHSLARNALLAGDHVRAAEHAQAGVSSFVAMRCRYGAALCRYFYGMAALGQGHPKEAAIWLQEAVETFSVCGDASVEADASLELAKVYRSPALVKLYRDVDLEREAARLVAAAKEAFERLGDVDGVRRATAQESDPGGAGGARGRGRPGTSPDRPPPAA
ncbi:NB-ARC domain-containing protein [Nonomuraea sp. NPDC049709]|uniref:NB-ARC domain-containing protein n=1 Tax=Nonomuraea sp. NPDC049709 TaxID=3154736 RepID=UPI00342ADE90